MTTFPTWAETPEGRWPQIMEQARMSESMVERVARAMFAEYHAVLGGHAPSWDRGVADVTRTAYLAMARAAIQAMAVPTEVMTSVGCELLPWGDDHGSPFPDLNAEFQREVLMPLWKAMIDVALSGSPTRMEMKR